MMPRHRSVLFACILTGVTVTPALTQRRVSEDVLNSGLWAVKMQPRDRTTM
jgi:hypothetical protein